jgi:prevent-host-death family protein
MTKIISAAEANRRFSRLLRNVVKGDSYVVTSHGKPVAQITPATAHGRGVESARKALLSRLRAQEPVNADGSPRVVLYDESALNDKGDLLQF